jgi:hypothetical protein
MLDMALDKNDGDRRAAGVTMLSLQIDSDLAGEEEKELADTVFTDIVKPKANLVVETLDAAAKTGDEVRVVVVDDAPKDP